MNRLPGEENASKFSIELAKASGSFGCGKGRNERLPAPPKLPVAGCGAGDDCLFRGLKVARNGCHTRLPEDEFKSVEVGELLLLLLVLSGDVGSLKSSSLADETGSKFVG